LNFVLLKAANPYITELETDGAEVVERIESLADDLTAARERLSLAATDEARSQQTLELPLGRRQT